MVKRPTFERDTCQHIMKICRVETKTTTEVQCINLNGVRKLARFTCSEDQSRIGYPTNCSVVVLNSRNQLIPNSRNSNATHEETFIPLTVLTACNISHTLSHNRTQRSFWWLRCATTMSGLSAWHRNHCQRPPWPDRTWSWSRRKSRASFLRFSRIRLENRNQ